MGVQNHTIVLHTPADKNLQLKNEKGGTNPRISFFCGKKFGKRCALVQSSAVKVSRSAETLIVMPSSSSSSCPCSSSSWYQRKRCLFAGSPLFASALLRTVECSGTSDAPPRAQTEGGMEGKEKRKVYKRCVSLCAHVCVTFRCRLFREHHLLRTKVESEQKRLINTKKGWEEERVSHVPWICDTLRLLHQRRAGGGVCVCARARRGGHPLPHRSSICSASWPSEHEEKRLFSLFFSLSAVLFVCLFRGNS